ncbi:hypothetical protein OHC33_004857 [Knufia fluminis]|uniref:Uncharacterized protein n=1 Tax=Knufia fluminis TaxID=191047 RepID=A0AAN8EF76_9EURO|nr:hypothetical protein OHC33_004857 [Knufia fluminis]
MSDQGSDADSVSQNIEEGPNSSETQDAHENHQEGPSTPGPTTTASANPQSQLPPTEQETQLAEFARRIRPATLTQNELRFLLQFRKWNIDAAVEMVPSFLSRKRERERREHEEGERRRQSAIEAAGISAENADDGDDADGEGGDDEIRDDENDRSWEDYIRRHEGEAALPGRTRSVEESNLHSDQSQETDHAIAVAIAEEQTNSDGQVESQDDDDVVDAGPRIGRGRSLTPSEEEVIDEQIMRLHLEESVKTNIKQETEVADPPTDGDKGREEFETREDDVSTDSADPATTDDQSRGPSPNAEVKKMIARMKNLPPGKKPPPKPSKEEEEQRRRQEARRKVFEAQSELQRRDGNTIDPQPTSTEPTNQGDESVRAGEREHLEGSGGELDAQIDQDDTASAAAGLSEEDLDETEEPGDGEGEAMAATQESDDVELGPERMALEKNERRGG